MKKLTWWFRVVGAFYTLLGVINLYSILIDPAYFSSSLGFTNQEVIQAFVDGWSPFAFEVFGLGTFMLWASRDPRKYLGAVWLIVWLELLHGVFDDIYLIARGYDAAGYTAFIVIHLLIIVTGVVFARQIESEE